MPFNDTPTGGGDDWSPKDHIGDLVICEYYEYVEGIQTKYGVMDAVRVLVSPIEGEGVGEVFDTMFFNASLRRTGKKCLGKGQFLGRLGQQAFKNGTGIVMEQPSDADRDKATRYEKWMADKAPQPVKDSPHDRYAKNERDENGQSERTLSKGRAEAEQPAAPPEKVTTAPAKGGTYTDDAPPF